MTWASVPERPGSEPARRVPDRCPGGGEQGCGRVVHPIAGDLQPRDEREHRERDQAETEDEPVVTLLRHRIPVDGEDV